MTVKGKSNNNGVVLFEALPMDSYWLEVKETNNYKKLRQVSLLLLFLLLR